MADLLAAWDDKYEDMLVTLNFINTPYRRLHLCHVPSERFYVENELSCKKQSTQFR
jgi:hypothetical protein